MCFTFRLFSSSTIAYLFAAMTSLLFNLPKCLSEFLFFFGYSFEYARSL